MNINIDTIIGNGTIVNTNATIEHGSYINDFAQIAPGVRISGRVNIGKNVFLGVNSTVIPDIKITDNVIVGANSLVIKDLDKEGTYVGSPTKIISGTWKYLKE